jgi:predicted nucleic acid-binding protein
MRLDELDPTELFMGALTWVPVDEQIARVAGSMAAEYRRAHSGIDAIDYVIAATATVVGADLLMTNVRHFPMISGLRPLYVT